MSSTFIRFLVGSLILLDLLLLVAEFQDVAFAGDSTHDVEMGIEWAIIIFFMIELLLKV